MTGENLSPDENHQPPASALQLGPRKRGSKSDPLVSHGRHFGHTVFALCNYPSLLTNGILRLEQLENIAFEDFSTEERREHLVFEKLLDSYPGLLDRLKEGSEEEILHVAEMIGKGASSARGEDTKSLKIDRGFNHPITGALLCPAGMNWDDETVKESLQSGELLVSGDQWPIFLYAHESFNPNDPWNGLLKNRLLINAYKHVFTSPSSVDKEPKATRAGNACLHGMLAVTASSIAYIATQVRFALCSSSVFSRTDIITDSETFYSSILDLMEDPEEKQEVTDLLTWWNRQIFPTSSSAKRPIKANSALAKIQKRCIALRQLEPVGASGSHH
ncbi:hypothetical protein BJ138DRAFT_1138263 [Hygrophoropsis aurantiaca]|uniref:Uncharacterized protein n=1 Tax=Hygrophoropsis aurantiaca TaxID=72124 RepID=A0ACB7ZW65_9AGAM|nr:hypothetical protein BJ138DRAFT_1138263 [Hygrophoropsis aurantiaca]